MQLQLVPGDGLAPETSQAKLRRPMRDFESAASVLNAPRRAELSRQRHCVAFEQQTIELRQAFRTAPEPVTLASPPRSLSSSPSPSSILRTRATSTAVEHSAASSDDSEPPRDKQRKKKKVSFLQTEPEHELELSSSPHARQCSCQSLKPSDDVKDMPSPIHAACRRGELQALKHLLSFYFGADLIKLINTSCACGRTPLEVACEVGDARIVKLLLKRHADPNGAGSATPGSTQTLSSHIRNHRRRSVDPLLARKRRQCRTCLGIACKNRKTDILVMLMQYGALRGAI